MKKSLLLFLLTLSLSTAAFADATINPFTGNLQLCTTFEESDGAPSVLCPDKVKVSNNSLTDNADGTVSLATGISIGATVTGGTPGSVLFVEMASALQQDNANFSWDNVNKRLGIGTASPTERLDVNGNVRISGNANSLIMEPATGVTGTMGFLNATTTAHGTFVEAQFRPTTTTKGATFSVRPNGSPVDGPSFMTMYITDAVVTNYGYLAFGFERVQNPNFAMIVSRGIGTVATRPIAFGFEDGSATFTEAMRILVNRNIGINETIPDYKLDVNGTFGFTPGASVTPVDNGDIVIEATNNTTLTFKLKGSDGVVRSGTLTLT